MSERNWLNATRPYGMLRRLGVSATERKLQLLGAACCRRVTSLVSDDRYANVVDLVESFADGLATLDELAAAHIAAGGLPDFYGRVIGTGPHFELTAMPLSIDLVLGWCAGLALLSDERKAQCQLVRDIFGNPFRPVAFDPAWRTDTALSLAKQMYDSRDFGAMPILADALQDAGCEDEIILNHCRDANQVHVRGCWVVDLVLGKE